METIRNFGCLIEKYSFIIPDYQRAYSWGERQVKQFINDIVENCNKTYYLGHFILEKINEYEDKYEIVD